MKKKNVLLMAFLSAILCISGNVSAYSGGDGSAGSPFQIANLADFQQLATDPNNWNKSFILTTNINLSNTAYTQAVIAPDTVPGNYGFDGTWFTGVFDGNGHILSNLTIDESTKDYIGLFGCIGTDGQIKNLGIENVNIAGREYVGGLAGAGGNIFACYVTGSVTGRYAGGLVGIAGGTNFACHATGSVSGTSSVGGLVGINNGTLTACYAASSISGTGYVGGLVGMNWGTLTACFWDINTSGQSVGAGFESGASTETDVIGKTTTQMKTLSTFTNAGWDFVGEIANGLNDYWQMAANEYPRLTLDVWALGGAGTLADPYIIVSGVDLGRVWLRPWACYRLGGNLDLSGISWSSAVVPRFAGVFDGHGLVISHLTINQPKSDYIGLFGFVDAGGQISNLGLEDVNIVTGKDHVGGLVGSNGGTLTSCYVTGSVNGGGSGLVGGNSGTITDCYATGSVNGGGGGLAGFNDGSITSCYATGSVSGGDGVGGLVGGNRGTLTSCYATGSVSGGDSVGGLVGYNASDYHSYRTISQCYATGSVTGTGDEVGGLVGHNSSGIISQCCATGPVSGYSEVGGLVGDNSYMSDNPLLTSCYATGSVNGTTYVGGLVGRNYYTTPLTSCYATGSVNGTTYVGGLVGYYNAAGRITSCFWNTSTSGTTDGIGNINPDPIGVTGKATAEMMTLSTFTSPPASWDFTNEILNGTNDIWRMCVNGIDYPRLNWQSTDGDLACPNGVAVEDLAVFTPQWLSGSCTSANNFCGGADINMDGKVDLADFAIFANNWLSGI